MPEIALEPTSGPPSRPSSSTGSLAVRYRPRRFAEVVGQAPVIEILQRAIANSRLSPQLLFSGESGLGKTTLARITAAALLCETPLAERPDADACGRCETCLDITTPGRSHPDVVEFDAASNGGKDEIRTIAERALLSPMRANRKIYIIDEAHGLSGPGGQAFLKLLEEPPAHVTFMLATTDPHKMLKTNRGRCTEFELLAPTTEEMADNLLRVCLGEGWHLGPDAARAVVELSDPDLGVRATLMSLEKLAPYLDDGEILGPSEIVLALGASSPESLKELFSAIEQLDRPKALEALARSRSSASDQSARAGLISWALDGLKDPMTDIDVAAWRLETILSAPNTTGWLDLVVLRLASPPATHDGLVAATELANQAAKKLAGLLEQVGDLETSLRKVGSVPKEDSVSEEASVSEEVSASHGPARTKLDRFAPSAPEPVSSTRDPNSASSVHLTTAPSESVAKTQEAVNDGAIAIPTETIIQAVDPEAFILAVGKIAPKAAAILRASSLSASGSSLTMSPTPENRNPLREQAATIAKVAAEMGITLLVSKS